MTPVTTITKTGLLEPDERVTGEYDLHLSETIGRSEHVKFNLRRALTDSKGKKHDNDFFIDYSKTIDSDGNCTTILELTQDSDEYYNTAQFSCDDAGNITDVHSDIGGVRLEGNKVIFSDNDDCFLGDNAEFTFDLSDFKVMHSSTNGVQIVDGETAKWDLTALKGEGDTYFRTKAFFMGDALAAVTIQLRVDDVKVYAYDGHMRNVYSRLFPMGATGPIIDGPLEIPVHDASGEQAGSGQRVGSFYLDLSGIEIKADIEKQLTTDTYVNIPGSEYVITEDGILGMLLANDQIDPLYRLALATCNAPDQMRENSGGFYSPTYASGTLRAGVSGTDGFGTVVPAALEESTVDIAEELIETLKAQYAHVANSKVCMTVSEMLDALMRL
jgi:flagellar hook-basal body protein